MHIIRSICRARTLLTLVAVAASGRPAAAAGDDAAAALSLSPLFGDHAVLQRDKPVPIWGTAPAGSAVTVTFQGQSAKAVAGADGRWQVSMGPFPASAEPADLVATGDTTVTSHDIVVGEVWLCGGQSNMEFKVDDGGTTYRSLNSHAEIAASDDPLIRQIDIERAVATQPATTFKSVKWKLASPATVGKFTAVGYFFARDIRHSVGVPVGIILSCWGGTPVESWMDDKARASTSVAAVLEERWAKAKSEWPPERVARYPADMAAFNKAEAEAAAKNTPNLVHWPQPPATDDSPARPGGLFNAMIAPLEPAAIRGILWYQGETNVGHASEYAELLSTMIRSWRDGFGQGDLPFYLVQLANFGNPVEMVDRGWAQLRDAQTAVLALPATGMAVTIDIGDAANIHPQNKQEVARRLALIAKHDIYRVGPEDSGPMFAQATPEGKALRVHFTHVGNEIVAHGGPPASVEVAGADKVFYPAAVKLEVDTLLASSPDVPVPVAVRYAWTNAPVANLYSDDGLPVVPFRSDTW
jgi:sialate O-acetylesterase